MDNNITEQHPEFTSMLADWQAVRDTMKGESFVKAKGELYLPMTSGQASLPSADGATRYDNYRMRARFYDTVAPAVRGLTGIAHEKPAFVEVPKRMEYIIEDATASGDTLDDLARKITREVLQTGRCPLLVDAPMELGNPYIAQYTAESLINWKQNVDGYFLAVLAESAETSDDEFAHEYAPQYRVLRYTEAGYYIEVWQEQTGGYTLITEHAIPNLPLMPLSVAGSINTNSSPDEPPMLAIARSALKQYAVTADYYQSLHMTAQETPYTVGLGDEKPTAIGADTVWHLPEGGSAGFLSVNGTGIQLMSDAIESEQARGEAHGSKLLHTGNQQESAEAIKLRMLSQYATLQSVVISSGEAIEQSLRSIASWLNLNPDEVNYTPNTEFLKTMELGSMATILQAVNTGVIPKEVFYEAVRQSGFTEYTDDELSDMVDIAEPLF